MASELVRTEKGLPVQVELELPAIEDPNLTVIPRQEGRIINSYGCQTPVSDSVDMHDVLSKRVYDALCADPEIMAATYDVTDKFEHRTHSRARGGIVTFPLPVNQDYWPLARIAFNILHGKVEEADDGSQLVRPSVLEVSPSTGLGPASMKHIYGKFAAEVPDDELGSVAVREAKRILQQYRPGGTSVQAHTQYLQLSR